MGDQARNGPASTPSRHDTVSLRDIQLHPVLAPVPPKAARERAQASAPRPNPYLQHRARPAAPTYKPKKLAIHEPGKFIKQAEDLRKEQELQELMREVEEDVQVHDVEYPTDTEFWWDCPFMDAADGTSPSYSAIDGYIYDPQPITLPLALAELLSADTKPLFLTESERKKLRRERRLSEQRDRQEQIRLGLLPPEKPRHRLASLITAAAGELSQVGSALSEPTARETAIRAEAAERKAAHEKANLARSLDAEGRRERLLKKYREDLVEGGVHCLLAKFDKAVEGGRSRFKLTANARQNHLYGCIGNGSEFGFVYVEGGAAAVRRYRHLLQNRLDLAHWIVYEGTKRRPQLRSFSELPNGNYEARTFLEGNELGDVWRSLISFIPPQ